MHNLFTQFNIKRRVLDFVKVDSVGRLHKQQNRRNEICSSTSSPILSGKRRGKKGKRNPRHACTMPCNQHNRMQTRCYCFTLHFHFQNGRIKIMGENNFLVVCIPSGLNPTSIVQSKVHWELREALCAGSGLLLTADAWQGTLFRHSGDLRSLLGRGFNNWPSRHWRGSQLLLKPVSETESKEWL